MFKILKRSDIPNNIKRRALLYRYVWPFLGFYLVILFSMAILFLLRGSLFAVVTFLIFFTWSYVEFISPSAIFIRKLFSRPKSKKALDDFSESYLYVNTGLYHLLGGRDWYYKATNFLKEEFEKLLRFVLHPVVVFPYSVYAFLHFDFYQKFKMDASVLYFTGVILLWYSNETFLMRRNQDLERKTKVADFKIKKDDKDKEKEATIV